MIRLLIQLTLISVAVLMLGACNSGSAKKEATVTSEKTDLDKISDRLEIEGADAGLYFKRAQAYYDAESYDAAIADLEMAVKLDTTKPEYYHLLSDANMDYYRSKEALVIMHRAAKKFPERIPTLLKLSETQLIVQLYEASLETVAKIFSINPDHPEGHFMKGMNFRAMGKIDNAINAFQTATELDPEMIDAWLITGDLLFEKGLPIAIDYYDAALRLEPDNISALHSKAFYMQNNGKDREAIEIYKKISILDKHYLDAYLNAGILYVTLDSLDKGLEQFNIMSSIKPENHLSYYYRGLIYEAQGKPEAARIEFQNTLNLKSDFTKAKQALDNLSAS